MPTIGEQIRAARKAKGMTQNELASALNITRTGISKWETDDRIPDAEMLLHLSEVLEYHFTRNHAESIPKAGDQPAKKEESARRIAEQLPEPAEIQAASSKRPRWLLPVCAAALALMILTAVIIILARPKEDPPEVNPPKQAVVYTDGSGKEYTQEEFETIPSSDASSARVTFRTSLRFAGEGLSRHIFYDFSMFEENGIALHMDRIDTVLFYTNGNVSVDSFTASDIAEWGDSPDIPPYGSYTVSGGTDCYNSRGEVDSDGVGLKVYCTDAGNHPLIFASYIPFPAE